MYQTKYGMLYKQGHAYAKTCQEWDGMQRTLSFTGRPDLGEDCTAAIGCANPRAECVASGGTSTCQCAQGFVMDEAECSEFPRMRRRQIFFYTVGASGRVSILRVLILSDSNWEYDDDCIGGIQWNSICRYKDTIILIVQYTSIYNKPKMLLLLYTYLHTATKFSVYAHIGQQFCYTTDCLGDSSYRTVDRIHFLPLSK